MRFRLASDLAGLGVHLAPFLSLVGQERWFKRVDQLDREQRESPWLWKIVSDYHWLEMAISHQADALSKEGRLLPELVDPTALAALRFAAIVVGIHARLSPAGQRQLEGRLQDGLSAESGFAALYHEVVLAALLMEAGYEARFPDLEGTGRFDLEFSRGTLVGEVECKSLSADAGRRVHRRDFYRFVGAIASELAAYAEVGRQEVLVITLIDRLPRNLANQGNLRREAASMLRPGAPVTLVRPKYRLERRPFAECLAGAPVNDQRALYLACTQAFGQNVHVAGGLNESGGCLIAMRSEREDDTSEPLLKAMRKAGTQFTGKHPSFIAVQFQDIELADLLLPHLRRRAAIIAYALFGHYGATHINATTFCGFGAVVAREGVVVTPGFAIPNPRPLYAITPEDASPFLVHMPDADFAAAIGVPLPATNISQLPVEELAEPRPER